MRQRWSFACAVLGLFVAYATLPIPGAMAQSAWQPGHAGIGFGQSPGKQWVQMISSAGFVVEGRRQWKMEPGTMAVRFGIETGLHINSHTPHSRFLIPTTLTFDPPRGVEIAKVEYPEGVDYHFAFSPKESLSVYTGEFNVLVQVHARPGRYTLHGELHYQACDNRACNPPEMLPLTLDVTAK